MDPWVMLAAFHNFISLDRPPESLEAHRLQGARFEQAFRRQAFHRIEDPRLDNDLA